jgi:hypothetical protein
MAVSGSLVLVLGTTLSILLMSVGLWSLHKNQLLIGRSRSIVFLFIATVLAMFFSFLGMWLQAVLVLVLLILALAITIGSYLR